MKPSENLWFPDNFKGKSTLIRLILEMKLGDALLVFEMSGKTVAQFQMVDRHPFDCNCFIPIEYYTNRLIFVRK